jgi:ATP-binding protein involved in chromosome partitioning
MQQQPSLNDFMQQPTSVSGVKKIILVASAKGGVGKSTVAVNLAVSLAKKNINVAIVDADIYGPSIPHLLNLNTKPELQDNLLLPLLAYQIKCISIGSLIDANSAGVWRGPMITKILYQLIRSVNWQFDGKKVDVMIVDMPPGTGDVYLSMAEKFPIFGVIGVSTPQQLAVIDLVRSLDCFEKLKINILGLVENMSYLLNEKQEKSFIFGKNTLQQLAMQHKLKILAEIPLDPNINIACDLQKPVVFQFPQTVASIAFTKLADNAFFFV